MSNKKTLINWGVVLILLLLAGSAVVWPTVSNQLSDSSTKVETQPQIIELNLPLISEDVIELTTLQAMGVLTGIVAALVIPAGVILALIYVFLSRRVASVTESDEFQTHITALETKEKEANKQLSQTRAGGPIPDHSMPRWSVISTSIIILIFAVFLGMLINGVLVPEGEYVINEGKRILSSALPIVGGITLLTLIVLIWQIRPGKLANVDATDNASIPWDFIWVLLTGLLIVGLGIGLMVYFYSPA